MRPSVTLTGAALALTAGAVLAVAGPHPAAGTALTAASSGYCTGTVLARFPAANGITDKAGSEGGHLWWRAQPGGTCVGTVVVSIRSGIRTGTETLRVIAYDDAHPGGVTIITDVIPAPQPGFYTFTFGVHRSFPGLSAVCVGAVSCITFGPSVTGQASVQPPVVTAPEATDPALVPSHW